MAYQSEIEKLEQRYRENPDQWFAALADSYRKAGSLDLALDVVRAGLAKRPNYVSGHIVLGRCLLQKPDDGAAAGAVAPGAQAGEGVGGAVPDDAAAAAAEVASVAGFEATAAEAPPEAPAAAQPAEAPALALGKRGGGAGGR